MVKYIPKQGDIIWLTFDLQTGKEIQKTRPALTISPYAYNLKTHLGLFMPITSNIKGYPFELILNLNKIQGAILCDQIRSLDWQAGQATFITSAPSLLLEDALAKLQVLLQLFDYKPQTSF